MLATYKFNLFYSILEPPETLSIKLQKKERERLKERAENWKRIEALAADNPDMEAIAKQVYRKVTKLSHFEVLYAPNPLLN